MRFGGYPVRISRVSNEPEKVIGKSPRTRHGHTVEMQGWEAKNEGLRGDQPQE